MGRPGLIPSRYAGLARDVKPGDQILMYDGHIGLRVKRIEDQDIHCEVEFGRQMFDGKGINLPGIEISTPTVTAKDRADARFMVGLGVDFLALSFVRHAADVLTLRKVIGKAGAHTPLIAKIEKPEALENIDGILEAADGVMVARGDLGVETPAERLPVIQDQLVRMSVESNKPVIMATQMLESMVTSAMPTRAEVTDVASAAFAGTDAVMLSGETANGDYPVESVEAMDRILREIEAYQYGQDRFDSIGRRDDGAPDASNPEVALSRATALLSRDLGVQFIAVPVHTGRTAFWISAARPAANIVAMTTDDAICRRCALYWGVHARRTTKKEMRHVDRLARAAILELAPEAKGTRALLVWNARGGAHGDREGREPSVTILAV
jgi:pyruvate kinase